MIGDNPITAADLDVVGALAPTITPPMTKAFRRLCDRAKADIFSVEWELKAYAPQRRREVVFEAGDEVQLRSRHLPPQNSCCGITHVPPDGLARASPQ
ncbi:uncharacterized protein EMH_0066770 [Eimeria mitis]|uniref:Uncharacterized protein n=1 Tax=Eimeria mitis TaxID=44415 RepID=U6KD56_9EIME|nr:uncharacterized protein EMH_0000730 [Eimeria mitis]XP_037878449.1 uncharacterized protein EMH_0066770 [Eimeria mitis]CDJ35854.1 hypothetical protein EMH_0000730 [Eimeria mitis]CDJ36160.1 hypothetical protein, conserved [Eimeria mitis]